MQQWVGEPGITTALKSHFHQGNGQYYTYSGQDLVLYQSGPKYGAAPDPPFMCSTEYNSDNLEAAKQRM